MARVKKPAADAAPKAKVKPRKAVKRQSKPKPRQRPTGRPSAADAAMLSEIRRTIGFQPGNRLWEARSSAGPKPLFANGDELWPACVEYFEWVEVNPLWEDNLVTFQGQAKHVPLLKMRAMTIMGLCVFLDITLETWRAWRESRPDLSAVIARVEHIIYSQKFAGAAADLLNANIISRELGLSDKTEMTGKDGKDLIPEGPVDKMELARWVAFTMISATEEAKKLTKPDDGKA